MTEKLKARTDKIKAKLKKYGLKSKESSKGERKISKVMREFKKGELDIGKSDKPVKSRKQAIAIALSEGRKVDPKIPKAPAKKPKKKTPLLFLEKRGSFLF